MQADFYNHLVVANLGWPEIVAVLSISLLLFLVWRFPDIRSGLRCGFRLFEEESKLAGRNLDGIFGKPAAEALTPENQTAELYDPAAFVTKGEKPHDSWVVRLWKWLREWAKKHTSRDGK